MEFIDIFSTSMSKTTTKSLSLTVIIGMEKNVGIRSVIKNEKKSLKLLDM